MLEACNRTTGDASWTQHAHEARAVATAKDSGAYVTAGCLSASLGYSSPKPSNLPSNLAVDLTLRRTRRNVWRHFLARGPRAARRATRAHVDPKVSPPDNFPHRLHAARAGRPERPGDHGQGSSAGRRGRPARQVDLQTRQPHPRPAVRRPPRQQRSSASTAARRSRSLCFSTTRGSAPSARRAAAAAPERRRRQRAPRQAVNYGAARLDVLYASERDRQRRDAAVRHAFPTGDSRVLDSHVSVGKTLYAALLSATT